MKTATRVSIYNFAYAVDDGATLPLHYENRVPEVNLNPVWSMNLPVSPFSTGVDNYADEAGCVFH